VVWAATDPLRNADLQGMPLRAEVADENEFWLG
jgi:hypothetical protein